jgi:sRNA-binding protein
MGWSRPYTLGVLRHWKMTAAYCQAILRHDQRIALDGAPAEPVGAEAKDMAAKQLARLAARKAATKAAKAAAPGRGEAASWPQPVNRNTTQDAGAIADPRACRALDPERIAGAAATIVPHMNAAVLADGWTEGTLASCRRGTFEP